MKTKTKKEQRIMDAEGVLTFLDSELENGFDYEVSKDDNVTIFYKSVELGQMSISVLRGGYAMTFSGIAEMMVRSLHRGDSNPIILNYVESLKQQNQLDLQVEAKQSRLLRLQKSGVQSDFVNRSISLIEEELTTIELEKKHLREKTAKLESLEEIKAYQIIQSWSQPA